MDNIEFFETTDIPALPADSTGEELLGRFRKPGLLPRELRRDSEGVAYIDSRGRNERGWMPALRPDEVSQDTTFVLLKFSPPAPKYGEEPVSWNRFHDNILNKMREKGVRPATLREGLRFMPAFRRLCLEGCVSGGELEQRFSMLGHACRSRGYAVLSRTQFVETGKVNWVLRTIHRDQLVGVRYHLGVIPRIE